MIQVNYDGDFYLETLQCHWRNFVWEKNLYLMAGKSHVQEGAVIFQHCLYIAVLQRFNELFFIVNQKHMFLVIL